jgi:hypothetical protein
MPEIGQNLSHYSLVEKINRSSRTAKNHDRGELAGGAQATRSAEMIRDSKFEIRNW